MTGPQAHILADGGRLHLHHGPIDLIIEVFGSERDRCYARAVERFQTVLTTLVEELPQLRQRYCAKTRFAGPVARRMAAAVAPYDRVFVTPMAAVAGAVADDMLAALLAGSRATKAYVNNGGDIAFHLGPMENLTSRGPTGEVLIRHDDRARGLATSGWRGRSHSLGIADAVTVAASSAAAADVAATLIANAVDLPGHTGITRQPADELAPDSDLGARQVTTDVAALSAGEIDIALSRGARLAQSLCDQGLIHQAVLALQGSMRSISAPSVSPQSGAIAHA